MSHDHPHGKPITLLKFSEIKDIIVDDSAFDKIFNHPEIQDRKVVILSLIGSFRGGKSFFLDYCLRFLYDHFPSINNKWESTQFIFEKNESWMGKSDEPLVGFSWRSGTKRDTTGIIMWSDVFLHTFDRTGEKVAIFVMDTQGLFDNDSNSSENSRIFALGTLVSSIQVLNVLNRIQEDQLQYLQFATEFTKFTALEKDELNEKPFQDLMFLIRDWADDDEYELGIDGGNLYFDYVLKTEYRRDQLTTVRESIKKSFERIRCCLLPYPGGSVVGDSKYKGHWSGMDEDFKNELKKSIEHILLPDNLTKKKINSQELKVSEIKKYINQYFNLFKSKVPNTFTIYEMTVKNQMRNVVEKCIDDYNLEIYLNRDLINIASIHVVHEKCMEKALQLYNEEKKMAKGDLVTVYRINLEKKLADIYAQNESYLRGESESNKNEKARLQAIVDNERKLKIEAEEAKTQAEQKLKQLMQELSDNKIDNTTYDYQEKVLSDRIAAETLKLTSLTAVQQSKKAFRDVLILAIRVVLATVTIAKGDADFLIDSFIG